MDIDGSLSALSISEFQTAVDIDTSISSDAMEVDSISDLHNDVSSIETIREHDLNTSTPIKRMDIEVDAENSSFVSALSSALLSPTTVGAKYAMKLLPAPESTANEDDEIDTTTVRTLVTRHINSFSSNSDNSVFLDREPEFVYNPSKQDYDEEDIYSNSMNQSYLYRRYNRMSPTPTPIMPTTVPRDEDLSRYSNMSTPTSIQVHHHHYYCSPNKSVDTTQNDTSYMSVNSFSHSVNMLEDVKLPSPWKQESIPKEKYPYIISTYLQLSINFGVSIYGIYLIYNIIRTIRKDIDVKILQQSVQLALEIEECTKKYHDNNCSPDLIVPALEKHCSYWLSCMNQNSHPNFSGNKSSISAETLGLILNSLIEPLGFKFFVILFSFLVMVFALNFIFGFIRAKTYYGEQPTPDSAGK
ncbi:hypothetical protein PSN45_003849 [Yamadazyma tenuis]|uniref:Brl1/Brr6 domain-containing protein n=1 Tax=Candida tenuis (strain ATCC 10573 / BCRC 21748 / CBS 615 / JCM 9827 / NBRC 10315 / NRRL Y-1498 / VKM Y-70) TaxID=590646 RepID=G3B317_CANTC|nr:uncharacterized protein CANTEDRAFT_134637 [Yamadazyma tenuis ATCC 10573]EGV64058.1 hypothetical protein CANTEDRAFT_134637 [Yamadazyma tenuis ATCC 10573]WEJ96312.1 hypothetical protein PSN45_003849 [Yamadazyma tenuis]